jgi:hypothetical protein
MNRFILVAAALLLISPAHAQTYSTICGGGGTTVPIPSPYTATLPAGTFVRIVRCGYTLASTATFLQQFTLTNPQGALLKIVSARDTNCEQAVLSSAPASDNALGVTVSSTSLALSGQPQAATGDSTGEPRVCIYVSCANPGGSCPTTGLVLSNYVGKLQTAPASGGGGSSTVGGIVGGVIALVCLCTAFAWFWRCQSQMRQHDVALQMQRQAQMQAVQPQMQAYAPQMMMGSQVWIRAVPRRVRTAYAHGECAACAWRARMARARGARGLFHSHPPA